jgi:hypothetical protein
MVSSLGDFLSVVRELREDWDIPHDEEIWL